MQITPISRTNFNGYGQSEIQKLAKYAIEKQKGSVYDLGKKFSPETIKLCRESGKIHIDDALQNWRADEFLKEMPQPAQVASTKNFRRK